MTIRRLVRFAALIAAASVAVVAAAPDAEAQRRGKLPSYAQVKSKFVPMVFFVAKGEPNACGPGCDTWISAEGDFDEGAGKRFQAFLETVGDRDLPIYFRSRGGLLGQAVLIGDRLYVRRMTASVGRTSPIECGQNNKRECDRIKAAPDEKRSRLRTDAMCASACVYAVLGGVRRHIPAKASLRVHAPRNFDSDSPERRVQFYAAVDRFIARAGVTPDLMKLTMSVPHEKIRTLTRNEIVKFGIERSEPLVSWDTVLGLTREVRIRFERKAWSGNGTLDVELRMQCRGISLEVNYHGLGAWDDVPDGNIELAIDSQIIRFPPGTYRGIGVERRSALMTPQAAFALASAQNITIAHAGNPQSRSEVSRVGLEAAIRDVRQMCPQTFMKSATSGPVHWGRRGL